MLNGNVQLRFGGGHGVAGVLQLFTTNQISGPQGLPAFQVSLRLGQGGLLQGDAGFILLTVDHQLMRLTHAGSEGRLRFFKRLLGIGLIQGDQHIAFSDVVGVFKPDFIDAAGDLGHHLHLVTGNVGIIRFLKMAQYQEPVNAPGNPNQHKDQRQHNEHTFALLLFVAG